MSRGLDPAALQPVAGREVRGEGWSKCSSKELAYFNFVKLSHHFKLDNDVLCLSIGLDLENY